MPVELIVNLPNRPGIIAEAAGALGHANVNIRAFAAIAPGKSDEVRFVVDDPESAESVLKQAGYKVRRQEVMAIPTTNTPGELAAHAKNLADAGLNIEGGYLASAGDGEHYQIIFEVSDLKGAKKALKR